MRKECLFSIGALLTCTGLVLGQTASQPADDEPGAPPADASVLPVAAEEGGAALLPNGDAPVAFEGGGCPAGPCGWASTDALLWWLRPTPITVPTLTTFIPGSQVVTPTYFGGALGVPGTVILSPDHLGFGALAGGRLTVGGWIDGAHQFGVEASGFLLENGSNSFVRVSDPTGATPLRIPFLNQPPGAGFPLGESSFVLADPGFASGGQLLTSSIRLWGAEVNGLWHVMDRDGLSVSLLTGFRYLDLEEDLAIYNIENILGFGNYTSMDAFGTHNQFYGGQLGVKAEAHFDQIFAALQLKVALGDDHESVSIHGFSGFTAPGGPVSTPDGVFAQATNSGRRIRDEFAVVPEVQLKLGYNITPNLTAFAGYDFIYISDVVRPGDQIDRVLNFTGNPLIGAGMLVGQPRPAALFNSTDFWAHGVNAGIQLKF